MLRTFSIAQTKNSPICCLRLYISKTNTNVTNLSYFSHAADAKDTGPCSHGLLVHRKHRRNLVSKDLERFQGLFGINCWMFNVLQNLKLWAYDLVLVPYAPLFTSTFTLDTSFFTSTLLHWGLQISEFTKWVFPHHHFPPYKQDVSFWSNVGKLPRILSSMQKKKNPRKTKPVRLKEFCRKE